MSISMADRLLQSENLDGKRAFVHLKTSVYSEVLQIFWAAAADLADKVGILSTSFQSHTVQASESKSLI